ncbi:hypothetical protein QNO07_09600 [Streptomyces sp. 549]|uniref:hypothetical protein n=1 Tax=Streptomyces sp. 549 TaxID=3049076 RepID=UPI0024C32200|nr:hypothetical protein [Streptomyces sp. 549]MDK1473674.1 hypothetical protein [Streptomyces sp. 549]
MKHHRKPAQARPSSLQISTCPTTGKQRYANRRTARSVARRLYPGVALRAYTCHACGLWHIGNTPPAIKKGDGW